MSDLLSQYVLISSDCAGMWVYGNFYPEKNDRFIAYNTPLISHLFLDDNDFLYFCEHYDELVAKDPIIWQDPEHEGRWGYKVEGLSKAILMIHEDPAAGIEDRLLVKWRGRAELGIGKEKIFLWHAASFKTIPDQRQEYLDRFNHLDGHTIFLTELGGEAQNIDQHRVVFAEEWSKFSQANNRSKDWGYPDWNDLGNGSQSQIVKHFTQEVKSIIEQRSSK